MSLMNENLQGMCLVNKTLNQKILIATSVSFKKTDAGEKRDEA